MVSQVAKYLERHFEFEGVFTPEAAPNSPGKARRGLLPSGLRRRLLPLLRAVPWLCLLGLAVSFRYDFGPQHSLQVLGYRFPLEGLLLTVSVSGLIGYCTNYLAIKMLFKPVQRRPILGQGLVPANKNSIARKLAGVIHSNLLSEQKLKERLQQAQVAQRLNQALTQGVQGLLQDPELQTEVKQRLHDYLVLYLSNDQRRQKLLMELDRQIQKNLPSGVGGAVVKGYLSLNKAQYRQALERTLDQMPGLFHQLLDPQELTEGVQESLDQHADDLEDQLSQLLHRLVDRLHIHDLLQRQIEEFDESELEQMIWRATNTHLLYIQYLGGLLGMLGGLVLWQPGLMLAVYAVLGAFLWGLDVLLMRLTSARA